MNKRIGIAGTGLFGRILAFYLIEKGWRVSLFDRDDKAGKQSCGMVGAGMLAPCAELEKAEPIIQQLGSDSLALWPRLIEALDDPVYFQRAGGLVVAHRQDMRDLENLRDKVVRKLPDPDLITVLSRDEIAAMEPSLGPSFSRAIYFPDEGQVDGRALFPALEKFLEKNVENWFENTEITQLSRGTIAAGDRVWTFDQVVDCRGLGAKRDIDQLRGVRGELVVIRAPEVTLSRPVRLMHPRYPIYVVPRPDQVFIIGATTIESEDQNPVTLRSVLELLSAAYSLCSGFGEAHVLELRHHCRPALADNLPKIFHGPGLLRVNGLYRHGYLIAPALATEVLHFLEHGTPHSRFPELWAQAT